MQVNVVKWTVQPVNINLKPEYKPIHRKSYIFSHAYNCAVYNVIFDTDPEGNVDIKNNSSTPHQSREGNIQSQ